MVPDFHRQLRERSLHRTPETSKGIDRVMSDFKTAASSCRPPGIIENCQPTLTVLSDHTLFPFTPPAAAGAAAPQRKLRGCTDA